MLLADIPLQSWSPADIARVDLIAVNTRVLVFVTLLVVGTALAFGAVPAFHAVRGTTGDRLTHERRVGSPTSRWRPWAWTLDGGSTRCGARASTS